MIASSVTSEHSYIRHTTMRHSMAMGFPSLERNQHLSLHKRRIHVKQCFPTKPTSPKATLPQDGLRLIPSCGQEELEEMNSFETDPSLEADEQTTQSINSEDAQQYSETVVLSPLQRPRAPSPDGPSLFDMMNNNSRGPLLGSPAIDDDSSLDDEEYTMLIDHGILRPDSAHPSEDYVRMMPHGVNRFTSTGGSRGDGMAGEDREENEDIYPFAWALDGRNVNDNATHSHPPRPTTPLVCLFLCSFVYLSIQLTDIRLFS